MHFRPSVIENAYFTPSLPYLPDLESSLSGEQGNMQEARFQGDLAGSITRFIPVTLSSVSSATSGYVYYETMKQASKPDRIGMEISEAAVVGRQGC
jgi:hypothetical protein